MLSWGPCCCCLLWEKRRKERKSGCHLLPHWLEVGCCDNWESISAEGYLGTMLTAHSRARGGGKESHPSELKNGAAHFGISKSTQDNPYSPHHHQLLHPLLPTKYPSNKTPVEGKFRAVTHYVYMPDKHPDPNCVLLINGVIVCPSRCET